MNYRQLHAMRKRCESRILAANKNVSSDSGIYTFIRRDENGIVYAYVGQAKNLMSRLVSHLMGYEHIDLSIKKRGLYDEKKNPNGWALLIKTCREEELDEQERLHIMQAVKNGYQLYNKTTGGQGEGKHGIGDGKSTKNYRQGVSYGKELAIRDIRVLFEKYLVAQIKGNPTKIKERKLEEFNELMKGDNNAD